METLTNLEQQLNHPRKEKRLEALRAIKAGINNGEFPKTEAGTDVNNHIHTTYSFSPYSPSMAVYMAYRAGLYTAGIMDHDSVSGGEEFVEAAGIMGILGTVGVECRVHMTDTVLGNRRYNNPDQTGVAYMALHGIPHQNIAKAAAFFAPYSKERDKRNRKMTDAINKIMMPFAVAIDYDKDVVPLSMQSEGGSVTERHLLYALSLRVIERLGKGQPVVDLLSKMGIALPEKIKGFLLDESNPMYDYDLLGALKSSLVEQFYIDAEAECPKVSEVIALSKEIGAISAYAYLGDVGQSVTGDKKTQCFEDSYLEELFLFLSTMGFNAVTYMPSRNTPEQLTRLRALCEEYGLFQISGEDINSPRQSFICMAQRAPEFANLYDSTMALIGHEQAATKDISLAMFGQEAVKTRPALADRIKYYKDCVGE